MVGRRSRIKPIENENDDNDLIQANATIISGVLILFL